VACGCPKQALPGVGAAGRALAKNHLGDDLLLDRTMFFGFIVPAA
jgi:hypothetical protein